jgi:hypothetical protein
MPSRCLRLSHLTEHASEWKRQNRISSRPFGSGHSALPDIEESHGSHWNSFEER